MSLLYINNLLNYANNSTTTQRALDYQLIQNISSHSYYGVYHCLYNGANPNYIDPYYNLTALQLAAKSDYNYSIVEILLDCNAYVNTYIASTTPLHLAAEYNAPDVASLLLQHGADVNCKDYYGFTPLHLAAKYNCDEVAEILLDYYADTNSYTYNFYSPLDIAIQNRSWDVVDVLHNYDDIILYNIDLYESYNPTDIVVAFTII